MLNTPTWWYDKQGATIKQDDRTGAIIIARIMHGGAADRSGLIHVGDEVQEVNNLNVLGKTPADVLKILVSHMLFCIRLWSVYSFFRVCFHNGSPYNFTLMS